MKIITLRMFAAALFALFAVTSVANAQGTVRLRRHDRAGQGPVYVIKLRDGTEAKVSLTESALVVAIVKASLSDIKQGFYLWEQLECRRLMEARKQSRCIFSPRRCAERAKGTTPWDLRPQSHDDQRERRTDRRRRRWTVADPEIRGRRKEGSRHSRHHDRHICLRETKARSRREQKFSLLPQASRRMERFRPRELTTARTGLGLRCDRGRLVIK